MSGVTARTVAPPVMEARRWLDGVAFPADRPLINVSQAAPVDPPPPPLRAEIARIAAQDDAAHLYGPVLGLPALREQVAADWSMAYGGRIDAAQVAITSGCNQAFAAAIATLCRPGDAVALPVPWYFNHAMWLDMAGVRIVPLPVGPDMVPVAEDCAALIDADVKAIALVTPNNPTGAEYPAGTVAAFLSLARARGITLILDETYRDFDARDGAPHDAFAGEWDDTLVHLYSFSKAYRLTGHRVGAMLASPARLAEAEKFLDTVAICPNGIGQRAALWGMRNLRAWLAGERAEILSRRAAVHEAMTILDPIGWKLAGCGAYFAYLEHPDPRPSNVFAPALVRDAGVLTLPGTMFHPPGGGARHLRVAFANEGAAGIAAMAGRLASI
ncbi:MAG: aminotransferase [Paracoccaceae bacterium]